MVKFIHCADLHLDSPFKSKSHLSFNTLNKCNTYHLVRQRLRLYLGKFL